METLRSAVSVVALPKVVSIYNFRLGLLLNLLKVASLCLFLFIVITSKNYYRRASVSGFSTQWISSPQQEYAPAVKADLLKPFCTDSSKYDYKYNEEWTYSGITCVEQFPEERRGYKEGSDTLFMPTFYIETNTDRRKVATTKVVDGKTIADCSSITDSCSTGWKAVEASTITSPHCECNSGSNHFVTGTESLRIGLEHYFTFESRSATQFGDISAAQANTARCEDGDEGRWECLKTGSELMTLIVSENTNKVIHVSHAPTPISLSVGDILEGSGISLDALMQDTVENKLFCSTDGVDQASCRDNVNVYPPVRMTGLDVQIHMEYLNPEFFPSDYAELDGFNGPLCFVKIIATPKWVSVPENDCSHPRDSVATEMRCVQKYRYGVRVSITTSGTFAVFDIQSLFVTLGAGLVYLLLPLKIVSVIALYCLGPVSNVYKKAANQPCKIDDELADLVTKAIVMQRVYKDIAHDRKFKYPELRNKLKEAFASSDLDEAELDNLVQAAYGNLSFGAKTGGAEDDGIRLAAFLRHIDADMTVQDAVRLFDKNRGRGVLEQVFSPEFRNAKVIPTSS